MRYYVVSDDPLLIGEWRDNINVKLMVRGFKISCIKQIIWIATSLGTCVLKLLWEWKLKDTTEIVEHKTRAIYLKWALLQECFVISACRQNWMKKPRGQRRDQLWPRVGQAESNTFTKITVAQMRMLRWMCGKTIKYRIRKEPFLEHLDGFHVST